MNWYDILTLVMLTMLAPPLVIWHKNRSRTLLRAIGYYCMLFSTSAWHYANLWLHIDSGTYSTVRIILMLVNVFAVWKLIQFLFDRKS